MNPRDGNAHGEVRRHPPCAKNHESRRARDCYHASRPMRIFVSIAAYCDPVLPFTLERAVARARHPELLHFGIVDQALQGMAAAPHHGGGARVSQLRLDALQARGPCWARAIAMSLYDGEEWFLQLDSHMDFDADWDLRLVAQAQALGAPERGL